jgi:hypothetical protein
MSYATVVNRHRLNRPDCFTPATYLAERFHFAEEVTLIRAMRKLNTVMKIAPLLVSVPLSLAIAFNSSAAVATTDNSDSKEQPSGGDPNKERRDWMNKGNAEYVQRNWEAARDCKSAEFRSRESGRLGVLDGRRRDTLDGTRVV